ncbi:hypothetical protein DPEC_G00363620 [Dallia pectoralis]|nr:hypothetical protein DPEC_G00363620 [Dallia pectoralis]
MCSAWTGEPGRRLGQVIPLATHPGLGHLFLVPPLLIIRALFNAESQGPDTHPENQHARIPTASVWSTLPDTRRGHQGEVSGNEESRCWWKEVPQTVCDAILIHAKERFSFTQHLISAELFHGD